MEIFLDSTYKKVRVKKLYIEDESKVAGDRVLLGIDLNSDDIIKSALPEDMLRVFNHYKKDEWEKFLSAVTQWDVDTYLDVLP